LYIQGQSPKFASLYSTEHLNLSDRTEKGVTSLLPLSRDHTFTTEWLHQHAYTLPFWIFRGLIIDAAEKQLGKSKKVKWEFSTYHCVKGELPHENKLEDIDAVLITGSGELFLSIMT